MFQWLCIRGRLCWEPRGHAEAGPVFLGPVIQGKRWDTSPTGTCMCHHCRQSCRSCVPQIAARRAHSRKAHAGEEVREGQHGVEDWSGSWRILEDEEAPGGRLTAVPRCKAGGLEHWGRTADHWLKWTLWVGKGFGLKLLDFWGVPISDVLSHCQETCQTEPSDSNWEDSASSCREMWGFCKVSLVPSAPIWRLEFIPWAVEIHTTF